MFELAGLTLEDIRNAKLRTGMTPQQADAEMNGLLCKMQGNKINQPQPPVQVVVQEPIKQTVQEPVVIKPAPRKKETDKIIIPEDPLMIAYQGMMEMRTEPRRKKMYISVEFAAEMRNIATGSNHGQ